MNYLQKLKFGWSVIRFWLTEENRPVAVAWLITGRCNRDCVYCKWRHLRAAPELDTRQVKAMIDQMRQAGVLLVSLTGGEPLLRDDIGEIIRCVKRSGLACKLNTNGVLVPARIDDLRPLDLLQISMDGPPSVQDGLRGRGAADTAVRAMEAARAAGIRVQVIACLTRDTVTHLDEVLDFGRRQGIRFCFQILSGEMLDNEQLARSAPERDDLLAALRRLTTIKRSRKPEAIAIGSSASELEHYVDQIENRRRGCRCALVTATMLPDGRLIFCGNARNYQAFDALSQGFAKVFSQLTIPDCSGCVCVGKLRLSKVFQLDRSVIREMLRL